MDFASSPGPQAERGWQGGQILLWLLLVLAVGGDQLACWESGDLGFSPTFAMSLDKSLPYLGSLLLSEGINRYKFG